MKLILADTVDLMKSRDYRDRFVAEYIQLKIRYEKLKDFNTRIAAARASKESVISIAEPEHDCPASLLRDQQGIMGEYLHLLELRAKIEDIDLEDAIDYFSDKKRDLERKIIEAPIDPVVEARQIQEQIMEERRLELVACCDCIHYPICNYLVGRLEEFKLPRDKQSCDMFESVNGWGEERPKDESDVTLK